MQLLQDATPETAYPAEWQDIDIDGELPDLGEIWEFDTYVESSRKKSQRPGGNFKNRITITDLLQHNVNETDDVDPTSWGKFFLQLM